jgi:hypothetical membrane protein
MNRENNPIRALLIFSILAVSYFGLVILVLSLFDSDYSPVTEAASNYGVGRFGILMNLGFLMAGLGFLAFAIAYRKIKEEGKSRLGPGFLFFAGLILIMDSYFTTNLPNSPSTLHGTIHGLGGLFFFISAPVGILLVSRKIGRERFYATLLALLAGYVVLGVPLDVAGLGERLILLVIFVSMITFSLRLLEVSGSAYRGNAVKT